MNQPPCALCTRTPRPVRSALTLQKADRHPPLAPSPPGDRTLLPFSCRSILGTSSSAGHWNLDTMDVPCTLRLLFLPLLLVGTAPGDAAQEPLGNNAEICLLPPEVGPCRARVPSFYYSRYTQSCRPFMYGGCEGNANNFETKEACEEACWKIEKVPKICRLDVSDGQCGQPRGNYFFNLSSMTCEKFMSGGCHPSGNQFPDEATCRDFCSPRKRPSYCYSPKDEGLCSANVTRYHFNPRHKACEAFTYTGCGGNNNNFINMKDCTRVCVKALGKKINKKIPKLFFADRRLKLQKKQL